MTEKPLSSTKPKLLPQPDGTTLVISEYAYKKLQEAMKMAVEIAPKSSPNAIAAMKKIGIPPAILDWLMNTATAVKLTSNGFEFHRKNEAGTPVVDYVNIGLATLQELHAGTLAENLVADIRNSLLDAIKKTNGGVAVVTKFYSLSPKIVPKKDLTGALALLAKGGIKAPPSPNKPALTPAEVKSMILTDDGPIVGKSIPQEMKEALAKAKSEGIVTTPPPQPSTGVWSLYPINHMTTGEKVVLRDATMMYQPVKGTGGNSRYFVIGGNDVLKVAARYRPGQQELAIRIEGTGIAKFKTQAINIGFAAASENHCSLHMHISDDIVAGKAIASVLAGLGVPLKTPFPDINIIKNKA